MAGPSLCTMRQRTPRAREHAEIKGCRHVWRLLEGKRGCHLISLGDIIGMESFQLSPARQERQAQMFILKETEVHLVPDRWDQSITCFCAPSCPALHNPLVPPTTVWEGLRFSISTPGEGALSTAGCMLPRLNKTYVCTTRAKAVEHGPSTHTE